MNAKETLNKLFEELQKEDVMYSTIRPLLTKTQQEDGLYVARHNNEGPIKGLHSIISLCSRIDIKQKVTANEVIADFKVVFHPDKEKGSNHEEPISFDCRLIKEKAIRKPSKNGEWGVNISSFKRVDKKK